MLPVRSIRNHIWHKNYDVLYIDTFGVIIPVVSYVIAVISYILSIKAYRLVTTTLAELSNILFYHLTEATANVCGKGTTVLCQICHQRLFW